MLRLLLALVLVTPALASAQPGAVTRAGIGVHLSTAMSSFSASSGVAFVAPAARISIPIDVDGTVRVEPEFGFASASRENGGIERTTRQTAVGLAVSTLVPAEDLTLTLGARVRYARTTFVFSGPGASNETSASSVGFGPVVGGEYPFSDRFALGAEAGIQYVTFSDDNEPAEARSTGLETTAALTARFFF